ncbi:MAG: sigma-54-dependent Fis family transcriptional regulator [Gammaproteobacteria bacterium]
MPDRPGGETEDAFDRALVAAAWQAFVDEGRAADHAVRPEILESWRRSARLGIDPHGPSAPLVDADELARRCAANADLLAAASHTWQLLSASLAASDNVFIVTDTDGVTLDVRGNAEFVAAAAQHACAPGRHWHEAVTGTNAIGTALAANRPIVVHSTEHYVAAAKVWDCAAAPVRDLADGSLLGILDITSVGDLSDHHSLALAVTAAHQVEHALHSQALAHSIQLLNWYRHAIADWHGEAALLLDRKGRIIRATTAAQGAVDDGPGHLAIVDGRPRVGRDDPLCVLDVRPYLPPAELTGAADAARWHGGLVRIEGSPAGRRARRATAAVAPAFARIVTEDPRLIERMRQAARMAKATSPILLHGETGTGKELFASAIHACSPLRDGPFVAVNCGTLTRELAASELLGYAPGAFTGAAAKGRRGKFEQADGGTLFLDEVGELPLDVQVHLLRVLQDNVVVRVGDNTPHAVEVRIVAATHQDLERLVEAQRFRADLLFRLRVLALELPPLRERAGDIPLLVAHQLQQLQARYGLGAKRISEDLMALLCAAPWPGNVRELHGVIESMYILSDRRDLTPADLPDTFAPERSPAHDTATPAPAGRLGQLERDVIVEEITRQRHNMSAVARALGISRSTLYRKLREFGIGRGEV